MDSVERKKETNRLTFDQVGIGLFIIYIFTKYIANGVLLPSLLNSIALYLFLGFSVLRVATRNTIVVKSISVWQLVFLGISLFSMIYSPEKNIFSGAYYEMMISFIIIFLLTQYNLDKDKVHNIMWTFAISGSILVLLLIATGNIYDRSGRLGTELLGNANALAELLMISCICAIWLLVYAVKYRGKKILLILCVVADYYAMFLSGGRKYIMIPIIFMYLLFFYKQDRRGKTHIVKYTIVIILAICLVLYIIFKVSVFYDTIGVRLETFWAYSRGDLASADGSSIIRGRMIEIGLERWMESPIWGYGFNSFKYYNQTMTGKFYYAHNNFVEILYDMGLIGFIAYYTFYTKLVVSGLKRRKVCSLQNRAFSISLIISLMIYELVQVDYFSTIISIMLFIAYSMVGFCREDNKQYERQ